VSRTIAVLRVEINELTNVNRSQVAAMDTLAESIGCMQGLKNAFEPVLNIILLSLDASAVFMRTKALRALGQVIVIDPEILQNVSHDCDSLYWR
jgi:cohesin loading factor subunit SCC2